MAESRNIQIDCLKGIAILLMVLGHMPIPHLAKSFIFSFHMPLFFFISGYFYKEKPLKNVIRNNVQKVLLPYLFTCLIVWACMSIGSNYTWGFSILLANGSFPVWHFDEFFVGPLWFLACYFVASIGFTILRKYNSIANLIILMALWILAFWYKKYFNLLPFDILNAIPAIACMELGYLLRKESIQCFLKHNVVFVGGVAIWIICIVFGGVSMASFVYRLWFIQLIGALFGTLALWYIISKIRPIGGGILWEFIAFTGRISLVIVCAHSLDYLLHITANIADYLFNENIVRNFVLFIMKFAFVYVVYFAFKYIPFVNKIYRI